MCDAVCPTSLTTDCNSCDQWPSHLQPSPTWHRTTTESLSSTHQCQRQAQSVHVSSSSSTATSSTSPGVLWPRRRLPQYHALNAVHQVRSSNRLSMQTVESSPPTTTSSIPGAGFQTQPHTHPDQQQQQQQRQQQQQQQLIQQQQSASRRLLARFTSGLSSKPRSVGDFTIHLDEHHRHYSNGDTVKGHVRLQVLRPIKITHIVISLAGLAQVYKNPGSNNENGRVTASLLSGSGGASGRARTAGRYHGNGVATLFEDEVILCGDGRLGERTYQFNFELQFPDKQLPSSIDVSAAELSYNVKRPKAD